VFPQIMLVDVFSSCPDVCTGVTPKVVVMHVESVTHVSNSKCVMCSLREFITCGMYNFFFNILISRHVNVRLDVAHLFVYVNFWDNLSRRRLFHNILNE